MPPKSAAAAAVKTGCVCRGTQSASSFGVGDRWWPESGSLSSKLYLIVVSDTEIADLAFDSPASPVRPQLNKLPLGDLSLFFSVLLFLFPFFWWGYLFNDVV